MPSNVNLSVLRQKTLNTPEHPGVYIHYNENRQVLYIGKANNLQNRLRCYFWNLEKQSPKTQALVSRIADFEVILTKNENEALILEHNLIKQHQPPYNILLRDDKSYPYIRISLTEPWPQITYVRRRKKDDAMYFGPFPPGSGVQEILTIIERYFPLVKCKKAVFQQAKRPCNFYNINQCLAPCCLPVDRSEYMKIVNNVIELLQGNNEKVIKKLKKDMKEASQSLLFEKAAMFRDQIRALEKLQSTPHLALPCGFNAEIIGTFTQHSKMCIFIFHIVDGKNLGGNYYNLDIPLYEDQHSELGQSAKDALISFILQYFSKNTIPEIIICDDFQYLTPSEQQILTECLQKTRQGLVSIQTLDTLSNHTLKPALSKLLAAAQENAQYRFYEEMRIDTEKTNALQKIQEILEMNKIPERIECFDISTTQGVDTVASQVVFIQGRKQKKEYRRYILKTLLHQDDFAALREIMLRRFKEENRHTLPDLLLIDGGTPQVREVLSTLEYLGLTHIKLAGIAKERKIQSDFADTKSTQFKKERLVVPQYNSHTQSWEFKTIILREGSIEFRLITQIRDEAHRFALSFHRKRREKRSLAHSQPQT